ncbi:MAG: class I SAM-dependent methyltransferase [Bradyrhizobium sp.]|jgi:ubiquinone/menaquinone biosynthesis C-methylase UbiE
MLRRAIDRALELPAVYSVNQFVGQATVRRYRSLLAEEVPCDDNTSVLDLGCGTGSTSRVIVGRYCGVDINPNYIDTAQRRHPHAEFFQMDCSKLAFSDASFDLATSIATSHHLNDGELEAMTLEALRVVRPGGAFHIIDAILPINRRAFAKELFFRMDRGRFPRQLDELVGVVSRRADVAHRHILTGPLHDVAYLRIVPRGTIAPTAGSN